MRSPISERMPVNSRNKKSLVLEEKKELLRYEVSLIESTPYSNRNSFSWIEFLQREIYKPAPSSKTVGKKATEETSCLINMCLYQK